MLVRFHALASILIISILSLIWDQPSSNYGNIKFSDLTISSHSDTTYIIISSIDNTYGYEILINGKAVIRQNNIPSLPGLTGFKRKEDAQKAAQLVLKKITAGIMPPSIEKHELDSMEIKY